MLSDPLRLDEDLARTLEMAQAQDAMECANSLNALRPEAQATVLAAGGGYAIFAGADSPFTHALGIGLNGPVTDKMLRQIEHFYSSRGAAVQLDLCPLAEPSLLALLGSHRYAPTEFNHALVRRLGSLDAPPPVSGVAVRRARPDEELLLARTLARGFFEKEDVTPAEVEIGQVLFHMTSTEAFLAEVEGQVAGAASMGMDGTLLQLFADATLPAFRGRGVQTALIMERLREGVRRGCTLATAEVQPGTQSQMNYLRCGFSVAYTKVTMAKEI